MNQGLVSIMMPAYNAARYIGGAIESVLLQSYENWELIIVDDGSTDLTGEVIRKYNDHRIHLISQSNGGEAEARNTALAHMNGEFIAFLDADDYFLATHLEETVSSLIAHPDWDGVYTDGIHIDSEGKEMPKLSSRRRGPYEGWIFEKLVWASDIFGPPICVVIRRTQVVQRGLSFEPRIVIGPDWDFFLQYTEFANFGYIDSITCKYRIHKANISLVAKKQVKLDSLALCRLRAIHLDSFSKCSVETRTFVFYDLLVNLFVDRPDEQDRLFEMAQFLQLPKNEQARLLRIAAGRLFANQSTQSVGRKWLNRSLRLNPFDVRSLFIGALLIFIPNRVAKILQRRYANQVTNTYFDPFSDLSG